MLQLQNLMVYGARSRSEDASKSEIGPSNINVKILWLDERAPCPPKLHHVDPRYSNCKLERSVTRNAGATLLQP